MREWIINIHVWNCKLKEWCVWGAMSGVTCLHGAIVDLDYRMICWLYSLITDIWCLWSTHVHLQRHTGSLQSSPSERPEPEMIPSDTIITHFQGVLKSVHVFNYQTFNSSFLSELPSLKPRMGSFFTSTAAQGNVLNLQTHKTNVFHGFIKQALDLSRFIAVVVVLLGLHGFSGTDLESLHFPLFT